MSMVIVCLIGLFNLLGESTWLQQCSIMGIIPNLSLILVVYWAFLQGSDRGRRLGLWVGLLQDILFCQVIGFYGLVYYAIGHVCGYFNKDFYRGHFILPLSVLVGADLLYGLIQYMIYCFFDGDLNIGFYLLHRILPEICYTALVGLPLYPVIRLLSHGTKRIDYWLQSGKDKEA